MAGLTNYGTVFKVTPTGSLTTLHSFNVDDDAYPIAGLVLGVDGKLYGSTSSGGVHSGGTIFRITTTGVLTVLVSFFKGGPEPYGPEAEMVRGSDSNFYGTIRDGEGYLVAF